MSRGNLIFLLISWWNLLIPHVFGLEQINCPSETIRSIESPVFRSGELARLKKSLGLSEGQTLDLPRLDEGIRKLFLEGNLQTIFVEATCQSNGMHLTIKGAKVRKLRHLVFHPAESDIFDEIVRKSDLREGKSIDLRAFTSVKEQLRAAYQQRGYLHVGIEIAIQEIEETDEVDIDVTVNKNEPTRVEKIVVGGGTKEENAEMRELVSLRKGEVFSKQKLDESIERIKEFLRNNRYSTSKVEETGLTFSEDKLQVDIDISVRMAERFQYHFSGNQIFDDFELRQLLTNDILSRADATSRVSELVEAKYRAAGYHFVHVHPTSTIDPTHRLNVVNMKIIEGPKVRIRASGFSSSGEELSRPELERIFFEGAPGVLSRHLYWEEGMKEAVATFQKKIQSMGFLSPRIPEPKASFSDDQRFADLFFDIDLGTRTYISAVDFAGSHHFAKEDLLNQISSKIGQPLNRESVSADRKKIIDRYASEGFVDAKFADTDKQEGINIARDQKTAIIRFPIVEGTRYHVGKISIEGLRKTKPIVVLREMKLREGDIFDPQKLRRSEEEIAGTGLFSRVDSTTFNQSLHPDHKDIQIIVNENPPGVGELGLGGRYSDSRFRLRSFAGVAYQNLFGLNQTVSARSEVSLPFSADDKIPFVEYAAVLGYRAPYPLDIPLTYSAQLGLDRFQTSVINLTILTRAKIENKVEKKLLSWLTGIYRVHRFERNVTHAEKPPVNTNPDVFESIGSTGPGLVLDFRNDAFNPTRGTYHSMDLEFAHPVLLSQKEIGFYMVQSRNSVYVPLFAPFSLQFFAGVNYAESLGGFGTLPTARLLSELALGGQNSIRGIGFHAITVPLQPNRTHWVGTLNLRSELDTLLYNNLSFATFFDFGRLFSDSGDLYGQGFGLGFRYKTPLGPAMIDVAQGIGPYKQAVQFYFTVGTL